MRKSAFFYNPDAGVGEDSGSGLVVVSGVLIDGDDDSGEHAGVVVTGQEGLGCDFGEPEAKIFGGFGV